MIDVEETLRAEMHRLVPIDLRRDWSEVIAAARPQSKSQRFLPKHLLNRRRLVIVLIAVAAALVPLVATGAANHWWFLNSAPKPVGAPVLVRKGEWSGHAWQLVAYPSATDGLCFSVTPGTTPDGTGGAMGCGPFVGISRTPETKPSPGMTITFLTGSGGSGGIPRYIVGPVIEAATAVEIHFANGQTLNLPTFAAPTPLEHVRFYATQVPASFIPSRPRA